MSEREFNIGDQVYVLRKVPKYELGKLFRLFTSVASEVTHIQGDTLTLRLGDYTANVTTKYCRHYIPKIDIVRERRRWAWLDEQEAQKGDGE